MNSVTTSSTGATTGVLHLGSVIGNNSNGSASSPTPSIDSLHSGSSLNGNLGGRSSTGSSTSDENSASNNGVGVIGSGINNHHHHNNHHQQQQHHLNRHHHHHQQQPHHQALCSSSSTSSSSGLGSSPQLIGGNLHQISENSMFDFGGFEQCSTCKSSSLIAKCSSCSSKMCANCVSSHQFSHCYESHKVASAALDSNAAAAGAANPFTTPNEKCDLEAIAALMMEGKTKAAEFKSSAKANENGSMTYLNNHMLKAQKEINDTFVCFASMLEERKSDLLRDLESAFQAKKMSVNYQNQKARDTIDKMSQLTDFVDRLLKPASNGQVYLYKRALEQKINSAWIGYQDNLAQTQIGLDSAADFEFVAPNISVMQNAIKSSAGFIRSRSESGSSSSSSGHHQQQQSRQQQQQQQAPISRPNNSTSSLGLSQMGFSGLLGNGMTLNGLLGGGQPQQKQQQQQQQQTPAAAGGGYNLVSMVNNGNDTVEDLLLSKRFMKSNSVIGSSLMNNGDYEKWSNGTDNNVSTSVATVAAQAAAAAAVAAAAQHHQLNMQQQQQHHHQQQQQQQQQQHNSDMSDLSTKLLSTSMFPPKSQIKRTKMIYHCKFGEFGVLEGQFTEPSGVAVNAQNDIIVADTNNHRIQIFDKEGRFKFQFGECGKRDGQLLYPNRVAVVRQSGDIVVTERSPTHQVQIYNQYGQFVRKFGANILQHPRGVCVDNKGRIIVVECKVMRVIIFDQMGNVLNKFGCSKHLEFPNGVVVNDRQEIFISDNRAHCVKVFNYEGLYLRQIGGEGTHHAFCPKSRGTSRINLSLFV